MEAVIQIKGIGYREEALVERWAVDLSNYFFVVMRAFFAGPEKAPSKMNRASLVPFKDNSKYVLFIEKKLQCECLVIYLVGFLEWKFSDFHRVWNDNT